MADTPADTNEASEQAEIIERFEKFQREIEAETNPQKRRRLFEQEMGRLERERMGALVAVVENVRAKGGDEAAAEATLKALRAFEAKRKKRKRKD